MFVSQKLHTTNKRPFQKPNILRRKPKRLTVTTNLAPSLTNKLISNDELKGIDCHNLDIEQKECKVLHVFKPIETDLDANISTSCELNNVIQSNDKFLEASTLNIESFINDDEETDKGIPLSYVETAKSVEHSSSQDKSNWPSLELYPINVDSSHSTSTTSLGSVPQEPQEGISNVTTIVTNKPANFNSNQLVKFKCNVPNCEKDFWMIEHLIKHLKSHTYEVAVKDCKTLDCPVTKISEHGTEEKCPETFQVRGDLLKHLKSDHPPEDALQRWRAAGGGALACGWAGCARVFRLPCRLREHQRAHTGDRPYLCTHPGCGWAFRSASKLGRHARRHTGERRHACGACGRAFRRRDHLRDHARRLHHTGCEDTATENAMYVQMKKVNRKDKKNIITFQTEEPEKLILVEDNDSLQEGGAARTHCAWPLRRAPAHIDQVEDSSSNIYTVRSDLFLHGNVPIEEDSQHIGGADVVEDAEECTALDTDLGLIDSHPIDLMQGELMYDDAAVDESSFRVFLINGEELA